MSKNFQHKEFSADTASLLETLIHKVYTSRDIFLRELIANSVDACDKVSLKIVNNEYTEQEYKPRILIDCNAENNTLTIIDNGIGMDDEDMNNYLGTIAKSHTRQFMENLKSENKGDLIGQFGIGFYSAFMVADEVQVFSRKINSNKSFLWVSNGKSAYDIMQTEEMPISMDLTHGTQVVLKLKKDAVTFTNKLNIKHIIKENLNYIKTPILFFDEQEKNEQLNEAIIPWRQKNLKSEELKNIYGTMLNGMGDIYFHIHKQVEGQYDYISLIFIPSRSFMIPISRDQKPNIHLYVNGVLVLNDENFLPVYLRFIKGIVEAKDFPINVNRETIRDNDFFKKVKKSIHQQILRELINKNENDRENYIKNFWEVYGLILKEGIIEDMENRTMVMDTCLFYSAREKKYINLQEYLKSVEDSKEIYYFFNRGEKEHPIVESFIKRNNVDVLMLADELERICFESSQTYNGKNFVSVLEKEKEVTLEEEDKNILKSMAEIIKDEVMDVVGTTNLDEKTLGFFSREEGYMNFMMDRKNSLKLNINVNNKWFKKLKEKINDKENFKKIVENIYCLIKLQEGVPARFKQTTESLVEESFNKL